MSDNAAEAKNATRRLTENIAMQLSVTVEVVMRRSC